jgi:hypothetical protein
MVINIGHRFSARTRCAWLLCWVFALGAAAMPMTAQAFVKYPECKSFLDLTPLADESELIADDRAAVARLREMVGDEDRAAGRSNPAAPAIYNFNSLFVAIHPGVSKTEDFGTRSLIIATSIDGTIHSFKHAIRSPRYLFSFSMSSMIVSTFLTFYGDRLLLVELVAPAERKDGGESVAFTVESVTEAPCTK